MIERRFQKPALTSQYTVCPIPYRMDTYTGCTYGCVYCCARDGITFHRRNSEHKTFNYVIGNDPIKLEAWIQKIITKDNDYNKGEEIAFKERVPIKIGTMSDPFPIIEKTEKITYDTLKVLNKYDYPVQLHTKNPEIFLDYAEEFIDSNIVLSVTIISCDENFTNIVEPYAPKPSRRFAAIKKLTDMGFKILVKIQPTIYPKILEDLPELVSQMKNSGVWGFSMEQLKVRASMSKEEQVKFQLIGDYLGINLREFLMKENNRRGGDYELSKAHVLEYGNLASKLAKEYNIKFFMASNHMGNIGDGCQCCGTQHLRNYKILQNSRTDTFENEKYEHTTELRKCYVNFTRNDNMKNITIGECIDADRQGIKIKTVKKLDKEKIKIVKQSDNLTQVKKIEQRFWKPDVTSQFTVCPVPYHMDSYKGCVYNCSYCFARDLITFKRRKSEHPEFSYLIGNRADLLDNWIKRTLEKEMDYEHAEEVAFKERIPLKVGATSDPFPPIEKSQRITYDILKVLNKYDYPVEIQTKNPSILASYAEDFKGANWTIAVTLISTDEEFLRVCEPNAPSAKVRLEGIKVLTDLGFKVMVKIQPAIYPKIIIDLPELIRSIKDVGVWAFNIEGLKYRVSMPPEEQKIFQKIGDYLGINIRKEFKKEVKLRCDYEYNTISKMEYIKLAQNLAKQYGLKIFVADNYMGRCGDGSQCCGTEVLRDYKLLCCNRRTEYFKDCDNNATELEKCHVNFLRRQDTSTKTIKEVIEENKYKI